MHIRKWLLVKENGQILKGMVIKFSTEDLDIKLEDGTIVRRKYWEVRANPYDNEKEK